MRNEDEFPPGAGMTDKGADVDRPPELRRICRPQNVGADPCVGPGIANAGGGKPRPYNDEIFVGTEHRSVLVMATGLPFRRTAHCAVLTKKYSIGKGARRQDLKSPLERGFRGV